MDTEDEMEMKNDKVTVASARQKRIERIYYVLTALDCIMADQPLVTSEKIALLVARNALEKLWQLDQRECNAIIRRAARETQ